MKFDEFFTESERLKINLRINRDSPKAPLLLNNEALFHLPFLAMVVLMLSSVSRKPKVHELGQLVGECLEKTLSGFKGSAQDIGWSSNLRVRTVKALTFLELTHLVTIDQNTKTITATPTGRKIIEGAISGTTNLAITLQHIERTYRNIAAERQIELELS
ncbi:hypothetical protein C8R26_1454 [Nitrosomonas oligotropha]|uniref:Uncharacterized protein n=1 Tax=Nitrosomonas oligotropha TaxID=42354 RepID=A0A2T5H5L0_9PROT|nr:hypothetical protein [Nitrosomonas oligotropha]PTQ66854.1 hypothetical protein C8R26_1454 [Nitrosomonas oligotropha]